MQLTGFSHKIPFFHLHLLFCLLNCFYIFSFSLFPSIFLRILPSSISPLLLTFLLSFHLSQSVFSTFTPISFIYSFSFSAFSFPFSSLLSLLCTFFHFLQFTLLLFIFFSHFYPFFFFSVLSLSLSPSRFWAVVWWVMLHSF